MKPIYSLIILALLISAIWRAEVELRGWDGLKWLEYFHLAIPLGGLLFIGWILLVAKSVPRFWQITGLFIGWGLAASVILDFAASAYFVGGPTAMGYSMMLGPLFEQIYWVSPLIWGLSILSLYSGFRLLFHFPISLWITGFFLWTLSWHLGLIAITLIPERGHNDLIHSLKTGWMIPFCVIAVGLPIAYLANKQIKRGQAANEKSTRPTEPELNPEEG